MVQFYGRAWRDLLTSRAIRQAKAQKTVQVDCRQQLSVSHSTLHATLCAACACGQQLSRHGAECADLVQEAAIDSLLPPIRAGRWCRKMGIITKFHVSRTSWLGNILVSLRASLNHPFAICTLQHRRRLIGRPHLQANLLAVLFGKFSFKDIAVCADGLSSKHPNHVATISWRRPSKG